MMRRTITNREVGQECIDSCDPSSGQICICDPDQSLGQECIDRSDQSLGQECLTASDQKLVECSGAPVGVPCVKLNFYARIALSEVL